MGHTENKHAQILRKPSQPCLISWDRPGTFCEIVRISRVAYWEIRDRNLWIFCGTFVPWNPVKFCEIQRNPVKSCEILKQRCPKCCEIVHRNRAKSCEIFPWNIRANYCDILSDPVESQTIFVLLQFWFKQIAHFPFCVARWWWLRLPAWVFVICFFVVHFLLAIIIYTNIALFLPSFLCAFSLTSHKLPVLVAALIPIGISIS